MPGPKTHDIFYKDLKEKLKSETLDNFPNYDDYSIFAQGHDFLIYNDFYKIWSFNKLNESIANSVVLQTSHFQKFVYDYLKWASQNGEIEDEQVRLFIGPGYIMHHLLDAYIHPQIIYYAGDHVRDKKNPTWMHGIVENLLDIYMMTIKEGKDPKNYQVHDDFSFERDIDEPLVDVLNISLSEVYGIKNGGETFKKSFYQVKDFMKLFKYDPTGFKRYIFDKVDPLLKGTSSFSYHRDIDGVYPYLNSEKDIWLNPFNGTESQYSFLELYNRALSDGSYIVDELEKMCQHGIIHRDDIYDLIPNVNSVTGLECEHPVKIKYKKNR